MKGLLWLLFSATAMLSAFILPIHIWALSQDFSMKLSSPLFRVYFFILFFAALYHGLYRTKTILFDIGLGRYEKTISIVLTAIFIIFIAASVKLLTY